MDAPPQSVMPPPGRPPHLHQQLPQQTPPLPSHLQPPTQTPMPNAPGGGMMRHPPPYGRGRHMHGRGMQPMPPGMRPPPQMHGPRPPGGRGGPPSGGYNQHRPPNFMVNAPTPRSGPPPGGRGFGGGRGMGGGQGTAPIDKLTGLPMDILEMFKPNEPIRPFFSITSSISDDKHDDDDGEGYKGKKDMDDTMNDNKDKERSTGDNDEMREPEHSMQNGYDAILIPKKKSILPAYSGLGTYVSLFDDQSDGVGGTNMIEKDDAAGIPAETKQDKRSRAKEEKKRKYLEKLSSLRQECTFLHY